MAVYPGAVYRPLNQYSNIGARPRVGLVLHADQSEARSLYSWILSRPPGEQMSTHFHVADDGYVEQYVDTDNGSWCQMAGNDTYLSVECQGFITEAMTGDQVQALARLYRWLHDTHGLPYRLANTVGERGFGLHSMGGAAWGGHTDPGPIRAAQRILVLTLAEGDSMVIDVLIIRDDPAPELAVHYVSGHGFHLCQEGERVALEATGVPKIAVSPAAYSAVRAQAR